MSSLARFLLRFFGALTAAGLILGAPLVAAIFCGLGIVNLAAIGWQLASFGRLMHRIIEAVARQAKLIPLAPLGRQPLPIGAARAQKA